MIKYLVLDTNVIYRDFDFRSNDLRKLIKLCSLFDVQICIPEVVIDECLFQYEKEFIEALNSLEKSFLSMKRVLLDKHINKIEHEKITKEIHGRKALYSKQLDDFIKSKSIRILPYCNVSHKDVVKRIYEKKKPFSEKGKERGYKDYLIAMSVLETLGNEKTIIYTHNILDFSEDADAQGLSKIHSDYSSESCYVCKSLPLIIQHLHESNDAYEKLSVGAEELDKFMDSMVDDILKSILYKEDLYGELSFEPEIKPETLYKRFIGKPTIEQDKEIETFTISGKIEIQFECNFKMNNYEFDLINESFCFFSKVEDMIRRKGHEQDSEWGYIFYDFRYKGVFDFTYDLFEPKDKPLAEYDYSALTIYKVEI
ncbi:PIN domain-containing protein [Aeromonas hydrophila]|uniref:PIN domain-containing protein n=1 Tax=Aeromonas hydrophila TaxID=644 RepID=UPI000B16058A|nr:PIN domain-containing protein [Aeromonas hydrophila]QWL78998.1 DUF4935 domain-containing protein [Aeromonas hydrophila]